MSISFGDAFAEATGVSQPSDRALAIGARFRNAIPPLSERGFLDAALWWGTYIGGVFPLNVPQEDVTDMHAKTVAQGLGAHYTKYTIISRDAAQITEWWTPPTGHPLRNIGFSCHAAGILIIDIDPRRDGSTSWREFCNTHGIDDSDCGRVTSPRGDGGYHLWWRLPEGERFDTASELIPGVDRPWQTPIPPSVRYVTVDAGDKDPARRAGFRPYRWQAGDPRALPLAPSVLLGPGTSSSLARTTSGSTSTALATTGGAGGTIGSDTVDELLETGLTRTVVQNRELKRMACSLARRKFPESEIIEKIWECARNSDQDTNDPWTPEQIVLLVQAAVRFIQRETLREEQELGQTTQWVRAQHGHNFWGRP